MRPESFQFLKAIVNAPSPSGYEEPAAELFRQYVKPFANHVRTDVQGNVVAALNPDGPIKLMLAGHIDEIGLIVKHVGDDGLLFFDGVGDHDLLVPVGQRVWVHTRSGQVPGVIGRKPVHLLSDDEKKKVPEQDEMWIDVGARSREKALAMVRLGDVATYQSQFEILKDDLAVARGFDNKMGAFVVAEALRLLHDEGGLDPAVSVYAVGTVQEEIGYRGAFTASYAVGAVAGLAIDVSHATDYPGVRKERHGDLRVGQGPVITRGAYINAVVYELLCAAADEEDLLYQIEVEGNHTGTDATAMQVTRGGMAVGLVGVPLRYMHTPCEMLSLSDVEAAARLMAAFCRQVTHDTDFTPRLDRA